MTPLLAKCCTWGGWEVEGKYSESLPKLGDNSVRCLPHTDEDLCYSSEPTLVAVATWGENGPPRLTHVNA